MSKEYNQEQFWKLYENLPQELKEAIFSEETAENIFNICTKNEIKDGQISEVARYVGRVLFGILPENEFPRILERELKINKDVSQTIAQEINRLIFSPVKKGLSKPHIKETPLVKTEEQLKRPPKKDIYHEPIE